MADGLMSNGAHGFVACAAEGVQAAVGVREQGAGSVQPDGHAGLQYDAGVGCLNAEPGYLAGYHGLRCFAVAVAATHQLCPWAVYTAVPVHRAHPGAEVRIQGAGGRIQFGIDGAGAFRAFCGVLPSGCGSDALRHAKTAMTMQG